MTAVAEMVAERMIAALDSVEFDGGRRRDA